MPISGGQIDNIIRSDPALERLLYTDEMLNAIYKYVKEKFSNVIFDPFSGKLYTNAAGVPSIAFEVTVNTTDRNFVARIQFRFFLDDLIPKENYTVIDKRGGYIDQLDKLSAAGRVKLRILRIVYEQLKLFTDATYAKGHCAKNGNCTVWTSGPSGFINSEKKLAAI